MESRVKALRELIPEAFTDGRIDPELLRTALGEPPSKGPDRYSFSWAGKREAIRMIQAPARGTLVPEPNESIRFDETRNVMIEGENLETLKLLYKAYFGKVNLIYIDPPYNTGGDFVYPDDFSDSLVAYLRLSGQSDEAGNLLTSNPESSGRFHSNWLSMMYPRLFIARQLLSEDGVLFVSIDDNEVHNLRLLLNEIFGEENFVAQITWEKRSGPPNDRVIGNVHEYILVYARSSASVQLALLPRPDEDKARYTNPDNDPNGPWAAGDISANAKGGRFVPSLYYEIVNPRTGQKHLPPEGACWRFNLEKVNEYIRAGRIIFGDDDRGRPKIKRYLNQVRDGLTVPTIWSDLATNTQARREIKDIFGESNIFETPKPVALLRRIIEIGMQQDGLFLDFFAGSCSSAEAVLSANHADGGSRRFIMIQLPEPTTSAQFPTIAEVGKERIRRVIHRVVSEGATSKIGVPAQDRLDLGFKVFKLVASNFRQRTPRHVTNGPPELTGIDRQLLLDAEDPLLPGWTPTGVAWEIAIRQGFDLQSKVERVSESGFRSLFRITGALRDQTVTLCLDETIPDSVVSKLSLSRDHVFVCRDSALTDEQAVNLSLECTLKVL